MKTLRVNFTGGINQIRDLQVEPASFVAHLENADVRSGTIRPVNMPLMLPEVQPPAGSRFIYVFRGKYYFSQKTRDYTTDLRTGRDIVYYTEYGNIARKVVEGLDVPLGTRPPTNAPSAKGDVPLSPTNIALTQIAQGNLSPNIRRSYRLALVTGGRVLPASQVVVGYTQNTNTTTTVVSGPTSTTTVKSGPPVGFRIDYQVPNVDFPIDEVRIYAATEAPGQERFIGVNAPSQTSFVDDGSADAQGELASTFDQVTQTRYVTTFTRIVNGELDESGPSPQTQLIVTSATRQLAFSVQSDGLDQWEGYVDWGTTPSGYSWPTLTLSSTTGLPNNPPDNNKVIFNCNTMVVDPATGRLKVNCPGHLFLDKEQILFEGISPDPFGGLPVPVWLIDTNPANPGTTFDTDNVWVMPTFPVTLSSPVTSPFTGVRAISVDISSWTYEPATQLVKLTFAESATFTANEKVIFQGFSDPVWSNQIHAVIPSPSDPTSIYVANATVPTDTAPVSGAKALRQLTLVTMSGAAPGGPASPFGGAYPGVLTPYGGEVGFINIQASSPDTAIIGNFPLYKTANPLVWAIGAFSDGNATRTLTNPAGIAYVYRDGYILWRNIYRVGGTSNFRLVDQIPLLTETYSDVVSDNVLGGEIPTYYITDNGDEVIFAPPPKDLHYIISHYGMKFGISGNKVVWTPINQPDAWPAFFSKSFQYKPIALVSFHQSVVVLCEDRLYLLNGEDPETISLAVTRTKYGCRAPYSVQVANNQIIYLSDPGVMSFNGEEATIITELRVLPGVWHGTSYYINEPLNPGGPVVNYNVNNWLIPTRQGFLYRNLVEDGLYDYDQVLPPFIRKTASRQGTNPDIRSFYRKNKYYLYWQYDSVQHQAQTMVCIDLEMAKFTWDPTMKGPPVICMSFKPQDVCVEKDERAYVLMPLPTLGADPSNRS